MKYSVAFDAAVLKHDMKHRWGTTLEELTEEEKLHVARNKYAEAYGNFCSMMQSDKNDGSIRYLNWSIDKALGLRSKACGSVRIGKYK